MWFGFDAVLVLGKELRHHPERARRELHARAAAAAILSRATGARVYTLEARLRGQDASGSTLVAGYLAELGVPAERIHVEALTCSTRHEVVRALALWGAAERPVALTAAYHLARVRALFADEGRPVCVLAPEAVVRHATPTERAWIEAGVPDTDTWARERRAERLLGGLEAAVRPLPARLRRELEMAAGDWLRAHQDDGAGRVAGAPAKGGSALRATR